MQDYKPFQRTVLIAAFCLGTHVATFANPYFGVNSNGFTADYGYPGTTAIVYQSVRFELLDSTNWIPKQSLILSNTASTPVTLMFTNNDPTGFFLLKSPSYPDYADGLYAYYSFDNHVTNILDPLQVGYNLWGATTYTTNRVAGTSAIYFGTDYFSYDTYLQVPANGLHGASNGFTLTFWSYKISAGFGSHVFQLQPFEMKYWGEFLYTPYQLEGGIFSMGYSTLSEGPIYNPANQWIFWAFSANVSSNELTAYRGEGEALRFITNIPITGVVFSATNFLRLGSYPPSTPDFGQPVFMGYMDEVGIWTKPKTSNEIRGIFTKGLLGQPLYPP